MRIAIPSAFRADKKSRTVEQLTAMEDRPEVFWYVPEEQKYAYSDYLPEWMNIRAVQNSTTVNVARNAILQDFAGEEVVIMEDDVPWFRGSRAVFAPTRPLSPPSSPRLFIDEVAAMGFGALDVTGLRVWGVYPVAYSGTALKGRLGVGCLFLVGHAVGIRIPAGGWPELELPIKEDYELTAQAIDMDGAVVRLDCLAPVSVSGVGEGGTRVYRNPQQEGDAARALMARWPHLFTPKPDRDGLPQVALEGPIEWIALDPEPGWWPYEPKEK